MTSMNSTVPRENEVPHGLLYRTDRRLTFYRDGLVNGHLNLSTFKSKGLKQY